MLDRRLLEQCLRVTNRLLRRLHRLANILKRYAGRLLFLFSGRGRVRRDSIDVLLRCLSLEEGLLPSGGLFAELLLERRDVGHNGGYCGGRLLLRLGQRPQLRGHHGQCPTLA